MNELIGGVTDIPPPMRECTICCACYIQCIHFDGGAMQVGLWRERNAEYLVFQPSGSSPSHYSPCDRCGGSFPRWLRHRQSFHLYEGPDYDLALAVFRAAELKLLGRDQDNG